MIYLRESTIFNQFPRTMVSNILYIIKFLLFDNKNKTGSYNKFKNEIPKINISLIHIIEILQKLGEYIAHYIKDVYSLEDKSEENRMDIYAIDESYFLSDKNIPIWVIEIINIITKKIRLELTENRK